LRGASLTRKESESEKGGQKYWKSFEMSRDEPAEQCVLARALRAQELP
jgi:hypothetical protein